MGISFIFVVAAARAIVRPMMPVDTLAVSADPLEGARLEVAGAKRPVVECPRMLEQTVGADDAAALAAPFRFPALSVDLSLALCLFSRLFKRWRDGLQVTHNGRELPGQTAGLVLVPSLLP